MASDNIIQSRSLSKIYADLCVCCDQFKDHCKRKHTESRSPNDIDTISNPFVTLATGCLEHDCPSDNEAQPRRFKQPTILTENSPTTSKDDHHSLTNDALSEAFELSKDVQVRIYLVILSLPTDQMLPGNRRAFECCERYMGEVRSGPNFACCCGFCYQRSPCRL